MLAPSQPQAAAEARQLEPVTSGFSPAARVLGGRYCLEQRLGEGGAGVVWRARHLGLKRECAVKLLRSSGLADPVALARFRQEAEALGRLQRADIVAVTDFGFDSATGTPYLVMELLTGPTLAELLRDSGPLPAARALPLLDAIAVAIDAAHAQGILHCDLKPGNVVLANEGAGQPPVKVVDFGLAVIASSTAPLPAAPASALGTAPAAEGCERLTATGALLGTPLYVAPEVVRGAAASRAADLYSLGVIAYEMLAGRPPFQGATPEVLAGHLCSEPPPPPPVPSEVWQVLRQPLLKDPVFRPATAASFVRRLTSAFEQDAERAERLRWRRAELPRRLLLAASIGAAALIAASLLPRPVLPLAERWLDDRWLQVAAARSPDPRLLLVTLDEASLQDGSVPLAERGEEVGRALAGMFAAGARSVAVDLILPASWRQSIAFTDVVLRHSEALTLAAFATPDGHILGTECVAGLAASALGPRRTAAIFGLTNVDEDEDGEVRRGRLFYRDESGEERPSWAARAASALRLAHDSPAPVPPVRRGAWYRIDHRIDWRRYARISWLDLPEALAHRPHLFRGRLVLVGGDFLAFGDDYHRVPPGRRGSAAVSGLTLEALQADTIAAGLPLRGASPLAVLPLTGLFAAGAAVSLLLARRVARAAAAISATALLYTVVSLFVFRATGLLLPITSPALVAIGAVAASLLLRRALAPAVYAGRSAP
jgi:CHASE2 domain-containing sensor protein/tRNA A-37 threonylcarbamoyl transferase component Bud32